MDFAPPAPDPETRRGGEAKWGTPAACVGVVFHYTTAAGYVFSNAELERILF